MGQCLVRFAEVGPCQSEYLRLKGGSPRRVSDQTGSRDESMMFLSHPKLLLRHSCILEFLSFSFDDFFVPFELSDCESVDEGMAGAEQSKPTSPRHIVAHLFSLAFWMYSSLVFLKTVTLNRANSSSAANFLSVPGDLE